MWPRSLAQRTVGAGDVSLARSATRGVDSSEVTRALHAAIEAGLVLVEVAAEPDSEKLVGEAVRALRVQERVLVATRVPAIVEHGGKPTRDVLLDRMPPRYVQDRVEHSLRASRLEVLPLAQLDVRTTWRSSSAWPELAGTCERLVREGKVLAWGASLSIDEPFDELAKNPEELAAPAVDLQLASLSARDPMIALATAEMMLADQARAATTAPEVARTPLAALIADELFISLAVPYSLCERTAEPLLAHAGTKRIFARRPLAGAALTGALGPGAKLRNLDDRREIDPPTLERIAIGVAKLAAFTSREPAAARSCEAAKQQLERSVAGRREHGEYVEAFTVGELALRFVIDRGAIPLVRLHRFEHVPEALAATIAKPLSSDLLAKLAG